MKNSCLVNVVYFWIPYREHPYENVILMKIGKTTNVTRRRKQIQATCPLECSAVWILSGKHDYSAAESAIHLHFASDRLHGEWFKISPYDWKCFQEDRATYFPGSRFERVYSDPNAFHGHIIGQEQAA